MVFTLTHEAIGANRDSDIADVAAATSVELVVAGDFVAGNDLSVSEPPRRPATTPTDVFERFCSQEHAPIANALGWALGSHDLGREATDEAFARAFERWDSVHAMSNPAGWVYRVGLNWGRRRIWRRNKERQLLSSIDLDDHRDIYLDQDLADALFDLPIKFRAVVVMRHLLGYSERDCAEALGISPGTAKSRMSRGLERLRVGLEVAT